MGVGTVPGPLPSSELALFLPHRKNNFLLPGPRAQKLREKLQAEALLSEPEDCTAARGPSRPCRGSLLARLQGPGRVRMPARPQQLLLPALRGRLSVPPPPEGSA